MVQPHLFLQRLAKLTGVKNLFTDQVDNINAVLLHALAFGIDLPEQVAYIFATIHHHTGGTMQPFAEDGKGYNKTYGSRVWFNGKPYRDVIHIYYGRGYVPIQWRDNYVKLTKAARASGFDWDFENNPDLLLQPDPAAWAIIYVLKSGLLTGKKLDHYINAGGINYLDARRTVNKLEHADVIANIAEQFFQCLV